jgi:NAD(P)-dependent dehydrogenase (short-subunit alcohol dehydrogenase family)
MSGGELFSLAGKNVLITGATGYLGEAMAWGLAKAGANVLINSSSQDRCSALVGAVRNAGLSAENAYFDVTNQSAIDNFFIQRHGIPLHCLINNAYAGRAGDIEVSEPESYQQSYEIGLISAHRLLKQSLDSLRLAVNQSGDASVINIASMYGMVSPDLRVYENAKAANPPFYGAAKAALVQWTKYAACEFGPESIRVNAISPGAFPSVAVQQKSPAFIERLEHKVPMGRIGQANEVCGPVIFLASGASSYINGANIVVDGGWTCW